MITRKIFLLPLAISLLLFSTLFVGIANTPITDAEHGRFAFGDIDTEDECNQFYTLDQDRLACIAELREHDGGPTHTFDSIMADCEAGNQGTTADLYSCISAACEARLSGDALQSCRDAVATYEATVPDIDESTDPAVNCANQGGTWDPETETCPCPDGQTISTSGICDDPEVAPDPDPEDENTQAILDPGEFEQQNLKLTNSTTCDSIDDENCEILKTLNTIVNFTAAAIMPIIVIVFVVAGIQYSAANGNPQRVQAAKDRIYKALWALFSFVFLWAFLQWLIPGGVLG